MAWRFTLEEGHLSHETEEEILHVLEHEFDEQNLGDLRVDGLLMTAGSRFCQCH
jgi:hypothetical protein